MKQPRSHGLTKPQLKSRGEKMYIKAHEKKTTGRAIFINFFVLKLIMFLLLPPRETSGPRAPAPNLTSTGTERASGRAKRKRSAALLRVAGTSARRPPTSDSSGLCGRLSKTRNAVFLWRIDTTTISAPLTPRPPSSSPCTRSFLISLRLGELIREDGMISTGRIE